MKRLFFYSTICVLVAGCGSAAKKRANSETPVEVQSNVTFATDAMSDKKTLVARPLTSIGENSEASFSPDGKRILYHSRGRTEHTNTQIYEIALTTMRERRVTFHDGEDAGGVYAFDGTHIVYASTTDEIKEEHEAMTSVMKTYTPNLVKKSAAVNGLQFRPFELYLSTLDGSEIYRLTHSPGYDSEASVDPQSKRIVFVSSRSGNADLYSLPISLTELRAHRGPDTVTHPQRLTNDLNYDADPVFSPKDDHILWVRYSEDLKSSRLMLGDASAHNARELTSKTAIVSAPFFNPVKDEIIFSSNRGDGVHFNLYTVDGKGLCLKRLISSNDDQILPVFSPDGTKILFTSNRSGKNQIYMADYFPPPGCLDELP